ncbi:MAG TPA: hypothetical protein VF122_06885, partial [Caulobacteraceae bacterium]
MRRLALIATAAVLAACQPQAPDGNDAATPPQTALPDTALPDGSGTTVLPPATNSETPVQEPGESPVAHGPANDYRSEMR